MNESTKQKILATIIGVPVIIWGINELFSGDTNATRHGDIANEKVSVFDRLRANEEVEMPVDPLDKPLAEKKTPKRPNEITESRDVDFNLDPKPEEAEKVAEPQTGTPPCSVSEWELGNCDTPPQNIKMVSTKKVVPTQPKERTPSQVQPSTSEDEDMWASLKGEKIATIDGVSAAPVGPLVKAHCRMLGLIQDSVVVSDSGRKEIITLTIKGPLPGCTMPNVRGFTVGAVANISPNKKWITGKLTTCTDPNPRRPSVSCEGVVESITGRDVLEGEIYDKSFFGVLLEAAINTSGIYMLKDLAVAASQVDNVWSANTSASIVTSFQQVIAQGAANIRQGFSGREIHLPPGAPVVITFTKDVSL